MRLWRFLLPAFLALPAATAQQASQLPPIQTFIDPGLRIEKHLVIERAARPPEHGYLFWSQPVNDRVADQARPNPIPASDVLSGVLIFFADSSLRPQGVAALEVTRTIDCATRSISVTSFATYSDQGRVVASGPAPPADLADLLKPTEERLKTWTRACDPPPRYGVATVGDRPPPRGGRFWPSYLSLRPAPAKTVGDAIGLGRAYEARLKEARTPLPPGRFAETSAGGSILIADFENRAKTGAVTRMTWLDVPISGDFYSRYVFNVDCAQGSASQELRASYDKDGKVRTVEGGYPETLFALTFNEKQLAALCDRQKPWRSETFRTEAEALAAARIHAAEVLAKIGPQPSLGEIAEKYGGKPASLSDLKDVLNSASGKGSAPTPPAPPVSPPDPPQ